MKKGMLLQESGDEYREMLINKRSEVLSGLGIKVDMLAGMGRVAEEDQAQLSHDEFVSLHLNSLDYEQLRLIEEALERMDSGNYGICLACEERIPPKRLRALPWARYCVRCQDTVGMEIDGEIGMGTARATVGVR